MVKRGLLALLIPFLLAGLVWLACQLVLIDPSCPVALYTDWGGPEGEMCTGMARPVAIVITAGAVLLAFLIGLGITGSKLFPKD